MGGVAWGCGRDGGGTETDGVGAVRGSREMELVAIAAVPNDGKVQPRWRRFGDVVMLAAPLAASCFGARTCTHTRTLHVTWHVIDTACPCGHLPTAQVSGVPSASYLHCLPSLVVDCDEDVDVDGDTAHGQQVSQVVSVGGWGRRLCLCVCGGGRVMCPSPMK